MRDRKSRIRIVGARAPRASRFIGRTSVASTSIGWLRAAPRGVCRGLRPNSTAGSSRMAATCDHVPLPHQRSYHRHVVVAGPNSTGRSRHLGAVVQDPPDPIDRQARSVRLPPLPREASTIGVIRFHCWPVSRTNGGGASIATGMVALTIRLVAASSPWRTTSFAK